MKINLSFFDVINWFLKNNRINYYFQILQFVKNNDYNIGGIANFISNRGKDNFMILRHDIDEPNIGVLEMLEAEKKLGISSSWYFRWKTANPKTIEKIKVSGGEVGLHFETLGAICEKKNISKPEQLNQKIITEAREILEKEIIDFRKIFKVPCLTIASHGHPYNHKIKMTNHEILTDNFCNELGIIAEAYQSTILDKIDCYISDGKPHQNYGWKYRISLEQAVEKKIKIIYFLSHPNLWKFTPKERIIFFSKVLFRGVKETNREFKRDFKNI